MKPMVIYVSGAIRLDPDYRAKFAEAEKIAHELYPHATIYTPAILQDLMPPARAEKMKDADWLLHDLGWIRSSTHIARIKEDIPSDGVKLELCFAGYCGTMRLPDIEVPA